MSWDQIADVINRAYREDYSEYRTEAAYRKVYSDAKRFYEAGVFDTKTSDDDTLKQIREERMKLQTLNLERNRYDRAEARQQLYFEQIGSACTALPLPGFKKIESANEEEPEKSYICCLADLHYGAEFVSEHNEYSPEIFAERLEILTEELCSFIKEKKLSKLYVANLGDCIQGLLRMSDLKLNDSGVVRAVVEVSRYIATFLNELSEYTYIEYYHVPMSNHSQIRPIGSKANELADEDAEYIIGNYIKDLCRDNPRIKIVFADEGKQYIRTNIYGYNIVLMHGHQIKNLEESLKSFSNLTGDLTDYLILGHFHNGKTIPSFEGVTYDGEVIVCPSFIGSDPYSDSIMKGSKASVQILGFNELYGHTETYKIILN